MELPHLTHVKFPHSGIAARPACGPGAFRASFLFALILPAVADPGYGAREATRFRVAPWPRWPDV